VGSPERPTTDIAGKGQGKGEQHSHLFSVNTRGGTDHLWTFMHEKGTRGRGAGVGGVGSTVTDRLNLFIVRRGLKKQHVTVESRPTLGNSCPLPKTGGGGGVGGKNGEMSGVEETSKVLPGRG